MLAIGTLTRLSGIDATLGLAFAATGVLYPFFGTLLGWLGVALTGSDTASNILFGNLQKITSEQLGLSPILMGAANSSGGVMGKMIDAQSIVVASTATNWFGHEGTILRYRIHALDRAGLPGRPVRHAAGLCLSVHGNGDEVDGDPIAATKSPRPTRGDLFSVPQFGGADLVNRSVASELEGAFKDGIETFERMLVFREICSQMVSSRSALVLMLASPRHAARSADEGFPFGMEMTLDAAPQPGSKRVPTRHRRQWRGQCSSCGARAARASSRSPATP